MSYVQPSAYFLYEPLWSSRPKFSRSWLTNVVTTIKGGEQRSTLRTAIRHKLRYTISASGEQWNSILKGALRKNLNDVWGVPVWNYDMVMSGIGSGLTIPVSDTSGRELATFTNLIVGKLGSYEVVTIDSYTATSITLAVTDSLAGVWPAGTKVYPMLRAEMGAAQKFNSKVPGWYLIDIEFSTSVVWE